jgi:hypothetical protein
VNAHVKTPGGLDLHLHPKQWGAFLSRATEILYGGAAGGGKSYLMRVAAIVWCTAIGGLQVYFFRRIRDDLVKNHMEGPKGFRALLAKWADLGGVKIVDDEIRFWNGSRIYMCHCKDENDIYKYQGAEIHVLVVDELTHFTDTMYRFLRNRVRMVGIDLPADYVGRFPRILCGSNPGNIGHLWVKDTFVANAVPLEIRQQPKSEGGMLRQYIPARLDDNPSMAEDDPGYENRLEGLGSAELVRAMRWGDWDVVEGAFFDCWSHEKHVITPFTIPRDWLRFRSADWGSASPASIGWWAVVQDDFDLPRSADLRNDFDLRSGRGAAISLGKGAPSRYGSRCAVLTLPRGAIIRYREDYVASGPNKGMKLTAEQVADRIIDLEEVDPRLSYGVLDPSAFKEDGGPSIAERINAKLVRAKMCAFRQADNSRVPRSQGGNKSGPMGGWDQMRARLIGDEGTPRLFVFSTCLNFIRTVPVLQHDQQRPEDVNTDSEDHIADETRYACLSRPYTRTPVVPDVPKDGYQLPSESLANDSFKTL